MKKILPILLLSASCAWSQPAIPAPAAEQGMVAITPRNNANITEAELNKIIGKDEINLKGATVDEFLTLYAETVNRTILRPASLPAPTFTLRNQTPLTMREAIQLFDAVLGINGIAVINVGDKFAKAVPVAQANQEGAPIERGGSATLSDMGQYVTHVVQLKYVKPSEMLPIIQPFAKIPNSILPIEANGILVIRDFSENVKRMLEMIAQVDVSVPAEYISEVIPIKYALAGDIASALNSLSGSGGGTSVGGSAGTGGGRTTGRTSSRGAFGSAGGMATPNQPAQPAAGAVGAVGGTGGTFTERLRNIISRASTPSASGDITVIGQTKIIADERTNSLLVYATRQDMEIIKDVISKLDVVLAQVLIESMILGVSGNDDWELGVSASQAPKSLGNNVVGAGTMNTDSGSFFNGLNWIKGTVSSNASIPSLGGLNYFGQINQDWNVAIKALAANGKTEVLQRPVIMTTHATPGQFFVGSTVPYVTSTYYGGSVYGGPSSSYQQLRVGIQLTVTPFINPDGIVVMKIDQAIEEIDKYVKIDNNDVPQTASRTLSADVTVRDRDIIVLGGFIRSSGLKAKSGVPLLKDIPLLGALFSSTSSKKDRQELMVLMRPTVLKTPELAAMGSRIERERMQGITKFESKLNKEGAEYDRKLDALSKTGQESGNERTAKPVNPPENDLRDALHSAPAPEPPAVQPAPAPAKPEAANVAKPVTKQITPKSNEPPAVPAPITTDWTKPTSAKESGVSDFNSARPMTDEELKVYGRD